MGLEMQELKTPSSNKAAFDYKGECKKVSCLSIDNVLFHLSELFTFEQVSFIYYYFA